MELDLQRHLMGDLDADDASANDHVAVRMGRVRAAYDLPSGAGDDARVEGLAHHRS